MSFDEKIAVLIQRIPKILDHLETEEATKNALIMPFIAALGYDVFNPQEVVPEFNADIGTKKGEKVDYAVMRNGEVIFLIECKKVGVDLSQTEMSQLFRYFAVTKARIAILTNGIQYQFFSDIEEPNKMDTKPFLELNLDDPRLPALEEVKKLAKEDFNLDEILNTASELKYNSAIKKIMAIQCESPDDQFVKFFFTQTNAGSKFTAAAREQFTPVVIKALQEFINERISDRLRSALESDKKTVIEEEKVVQEEPSSGIITTEEELEGFRIVRAIVSKVVSPDRIIYRDRKSYMGILLDDNNRKPVCRLWFNSKQKYIALFDNKKEVKMAIESLIEIYEYTDQLIATVQSYDT
ncbi:type I restriction endonuclease [Roseofilum casamattae]|uniref:Type I restriction enzyme HsdR N-terminal domain-containing protein n=1 Tax=Roseofilum casamattae BLCC-M143 TaxID=3022442 RepID=A0ABT7C149_9CYAN|nr:type I restriction endonuclease [Roseofilum casamattae]MDJ1185155.1 type I restriction enzyme HsdR N-terminal domain-containing protein [Roseofilum casamattae BLCC-M143]